MDLLLAIPGAFAVFLTVALLARQVEKRAFNGGVCPNCARDWRRYDMDSQGGRGYTCDSCNKGVWVSYWGID